MAKRVPTVNPKADVRGPTWAYDKAQRMHAALADKADRSAAQREARKAAREEKRVTRAEERTAA